MITVAAVGPDERPTVLLERERRDRPERARASGSSPRVPGAFDPDGDQDGFAALDGHVVRRADGGRRRRLGARGAARADAVPGRPGRPPGRARRRPAGLGGRDRLRRAATWPARWRACRRRDDPLEPNDDIRYVDGRAFGKPSPPLFRGRPRSIAGAWPTSPRTRSTSTASAAPRAAGPGQARPDRRRSRPVRLRHGAAQRALEPLAAQLVARRRRGRSASTSATAAAGRARSTSPPASTPTRTSSSQRGLPPAGCARESGRGSCWNHCASARSPVPSSAAGVGTCGLSRRYHSASSAAWQPEPAAVTAWR